MDRHTFVIVAWAGVFAVTAAAPGAWAAPAAPAEKAEKAPDDLDKAVADIKERIRDCRARFASAESTAEQKEDAALSASVLFDSYLRAVAGMDDVRRARLRADADLMEGMCALRVAYAEHLLGNARVEDRVPYVNSLEDAYKEFRMGAIYLGSLKKKDTNEAALAGRIERGLTAVIRGLTKYAEVFKADAFMNPEGKEWKGNPAPEARRFLEEVSARARVLEKAQLYRKSFDNVLKALENDVRAGDGMAAYKKMITGARWLAWIKDVDTDLFIEDFKRFNVVGNKAMTLIRKGYTREDNKAFREVYDPLTEYFRSVTSEKEGGKGK